MYQPPKCLLPDLYPSLEECDDLPDTCIAPKEAETRCTKRVGERDVNKARECRAQARLLPYGLERNEKILEFINFRCCIDHHRHRLDGNEDGCAIKLIQRYSASIGVTAAQDEIEGVVVEDKGSETEPQPVCLLRRKNVTSEPLQSSVAPAMELRSGNLVGASSESALRLRGYFKDYETTSTTTIIELLRTTLRTTMHRKCAMHGVVYSLIWPAYPKYVKIGYSSRSAACRAVELSDCHPGITESVSVSVEWPERVENLIHLEMAGHRRKVRQCSWCKVSHQEWFELPITTVNKVINEWAEVMTRDPLYDVSTRSLTVRWRKRLATISAVPDARTLLDLLDKEEAMLKQAPRVRTFVNTVPRTYVASVKSHRENEASAVHEVDDSTRATTTTRTITPHHELRSPDTANTSLAHQHLKQIPKPKCKLTDEVAHTLTSSFIASENTCTDMILAQDEDQILAFFADFMALLLTQAETLKATAPHLISEIESVTPEYTGHKLVQPSKTAILAT